MLNLLVIIGVSSLGVLGDVFLKLAGERSPAHPHWLVLGTVAYILTVPGWLFVMRHVPLSSIGALYAVTTVLLLAAIGILGFHERLRGLEVLGLILALCSVLAFKRLL